MITITNWLEKKNALAGVLKLNITQLNPESTDDDTVHRIDIENSFISGMILFYENGYLHFYIHDKANLLPLLIESFIVNSDDDIIKILETNFEPIWIGKC